MCEAGARDRIYRWRRQNRELNKAVVKDHLDVHSDEFDLLTTAKIFKRYGT